MHAYRDNSDHLESANYDDVPGLSEASSPVEWGDDDHSVRSWIEGILHEHPVDGVSYGGINLDIPRRLVTCHGQQARLSQIDFALLVLLARSKNRMLSYARICRGLWGSSSKVSVTTLRVHVFRLRKRLDEEGVVGIRIVNRCGLGYMMTIESQPHFGNHQLREFEKKRGTARSEQKQFSSNGVSERVSDAAE